MGGEALIVALPGRRVFLAGRGAGRGRRWAWGEVEDGVGGDERQMLAVVAGRLVDGERGLGGAGVAADEVFGLPEPGAHAGGLVAVGVSMAVVLIEPGLAEPAPEPGRVGMEAMDPGMFGEACVSGLDEPKTAREGVEVPYRFIDGVEHGRMRCAGLVCGGRVRGRSGLTGVDPAGGGGLGGLAGGEGGRWGGGGEGGGGEGEEREAQARAMAARGRGIARRAEGWGDGRVMGVHDGCDCSSGGGVAEGRGSGGAAQAVWRCG